MALGEHSTLNAWLTGASASHPLRRELEATQVDAALDEWLDDLDGLLRELEQHSPLRLDGKRRDFRALIDKDRWDDLRSELILARWLARQEVEFEFGELGRPMPDIVMPSLNLGIEVTRRRRNGAAALRKAIWDAVLLCPKPRPQPVITLSAHPVAIRKRVLDEIAAEFTNAATRGDTHVHAVVRPSTDDHPAITAEIDLYGNESVVPKLRYAPSAAALGLTLFDVEDLIVQVLEDPQKAAQGEAIPSIVAIDVSDLPDAAWLRPHAVWGPRLTNLQEATYAFAGVALMWSSVQAPIPRFVLATNPYAECAVGASVVALGRRLGLTDLGNGAAY